MTKQSPYRLEAAVELSAAMPLGSDFLGLLKPAAIGGVPVHLILPSFDFKGGGFSPKIHARSKLDWVRYFQSRSLEEREAFGNVSRWNPTRPYGGIEQFWVSRLLVLSKDRVTLAEARKLLRAADDWAELLMTWVEVFTKVDLHRPGVEVHRDGRSSDVWIDKPAGKGKMISSSQATHLTITLWDSLDLTPLQWRRLLAKASDGERPPEVHHFLKDARHALSEKRYRRSVLDSATAAEVGLTKLRDNSLSKADPQIDSYVRGKAQQINRLIDFLGSMGQKLPARIQQEVGEPRNRAIHEGEEPNETTARQALAKAEEIVDLSYPWKTLLP